MNPNGHRPTHVPQPAQGPHQQATKKSRFKLDNYRISWLVLLFSATILVVLTLFALGMGKSSTKEYSYVDNDRLQAVFLNGGQVYFGKIESLNSNHFRLSNIYYLRVNQQVQPTQTQTAQNDISLVKLGCELHGPQDEMLINRDQVIFWENLKDDGQVAQAVKEYVQQNPNGQECNTAQQPAAGSDSGAAGTSPAGSDAGSDTNGADGLPTSN